MLCVEDWVSALRSLPSIKRCLDTHRLPNPILNGRLQLHPTLSTSIIDRTLVDRYMPKMVPNQFVFEGLHRVLRVLQILLLEARPVDQIGPAVTASPGFISRGHFLRAAKTMQAVLAGRVRALDVEWI